MRSNLTAERLLDLGLVDEVLAEPLGGAHRDPGRDEQHAARRRSAASAQLQSLDTPRRCSSSARRASPPSGSIPRPSRERVAAGSGREAAAEQPGPAHFSALPGWRSSCAR